MKPKLVVAFVAGALFAAGLALSGMTQPEKVIGFLDVTGAWDPSLALVMVGAIAVHVVGLALTRRRALPLFAERFEHPREGAIHGRLLLGSALFGVGWGIAGYCPGPAVVSAASGAVSAVVVTISMLAGIGLYELWQLPRRARERERERETSACGADLI